MVLRSYDIEGKRVAAWYVYCPACLRSHHFVVENRDNPEFCWTFDGNMEEPTFEPSLGVSGRHWVNDRWVAERCHSFLRGGVWQFQSDSTHGLAGKKVPMVAFPPRYRTGEADMFRSAPTRFLKNFNRLLFDDRVPEGTFCYGRLSGEWDGVRWVGPCIWIKMPYDEPNGAASIHCLRIHREPAPRPPRPSWTMTGTALAPVLQPSILCGPRENPHWHGYLVGGVLEAC